MTNQLSPETLRIDMDEDLCAIESFNCIIKGERVKTTMLSDKQRIIWKMKCALGDKVDELGQVKVAELAKTSQPAISRALNPEYKPKIDTLFRWLTNLGFILKFKIEK